MAITAADQLIQRGAIKILELTSEDFLLGLSLQNASPIGGLFISATDIDPYEALGFLKPGLQAVQRGSGTIASTPKVLTAVNDSGTLYNYIHTASALYQVGALSGTVTDITSSSGITTGSIHDAIIWRGKYVYCLNGSVIALTIGSSTNTTLLSGLDTSAAHKFCIGPDNNLYVTDGDGVAQITSAAGTSGNTLDVVTFNDTALACKDILNDGRYLVLIADAAGSQTLGKYRCVVAFWDLAKGSFDILWDTYETRFIGGEILGDEVIVFGYDNMYKCSRYSKLRSIYRFRGSATITVRPQTANAIQLVGNAVYWGGTGGAIYAYGTQIDGGRQIFFNPHNVGSGTVECLVHDGLSLWAGTSSSNGLHQFNSGSTRASSLLYTSYIPFKNSYKFAFARVIWRDVMASGEAVTLELGARNGNGVIAASVSKNFTEIGAVNHATWFFTALGTDVNENPTFDEAQVRLTLGKVTLERFELWAIPVGPLGALPRK